MQDLRRKLSDRDKRDIVMTYAAGGITQKQLAINFRVSQSTINDIICGRKRRGRYNGIKDKDKHAEYVREYRKRKKVALAKEKN